MTYEENLGVKANGIVIMVIFLTHILTMPQAAGKKNIFFDT